MIWVVQSIEGLVVACFSTQAKAETWRDQHSIDNWQIVAEELDPESSED